MEEKNFEYESESDVLYIYSNNQPIKVAGSLQVNNLVIDLSSDGTIVGLQIDNASEYLGIPAKELENNISSSKLVTLVRGNAITILYKVLSAKYNSTNNICLSKQQLSMNN